LRTTLGKKFPHSDAERPCEVNDNAKGGVPFAALDSPDIGPVPPAFCGQLFLAPASIFPKLADALTKGFERRLHACMKPQ
jgi:hypothetical protein